MGRWSQARLRGGGGTPPAAVLSAPVLSDDGSSNLIWTWAGPDPDHWDVEVSGTGDVPWAVNEQDPGSDRGTGPVGAGLFWRIIGRDSGELAVTAYSNVVAI